MNKQDIIIGNIYTQIRSGTHKGQQVKVLTVGNSYVSYIPVSRGYSSVMRQRVSIDRFCLMFGK